MIIIGIVLQAQAPTGDEVLKLGFTDPRARQYTYTRIITLLI